MNLFGPKEETIAPAQPKPPFRMTKEEMVQKALRVQALGQKWSDGHTFLLLAFASLVPWGMLHSIPTLVFSAAAFWIFVAAMSWSYEHPKKSFRWLGDEYLDKTGDW